MRRAVTYALLVQRSPIVSHACLACQWAAGQWISVEHSIADGLVCPLTESRSRR